MTDWHVLVMLLCDILELFLRMTFWAIVLQATVYLFMLSLGTW